jgi:phage-related protein (TIGR01555 family)
MKNLARQVKAEEKRALKSSDKSWAEGTTDSFQNLIAKMGMNTDNITTGSTYGFNPITRIRILLEWIYRGSWIGGVAVDTVANDMTRAGVDIKGKLPPEDMEKITEEIVRLKVWQQLNRLIKWSRLYGGAIGIMLIDGQDVSTPLNIDRVGKGQFRGMLVLDRWQVESLLDDVIGSKPNELGPDVGLPRYYRIGPASPLYRGKKVHFSRIVRAVGTELPLNQAVTEMMWGLSIFERLYDRLVAFDSSTTGASQLVYKAYIRTYSIEGLREIASSSGKALDGLVKYLDMMRRFQSIEGVTLLDAKDKFEGHVHNAFGGISDILLQVGQQLSGALQIPLVRLFGQSPAGLNSTGESDLITYYDGINQQQESELKIPVTAIYRMTAQSLDISLPDGFGIGFRSLWQLKDKEKSEIANQDESTIQAAHEGGLITRQIALKELRQSSSRTGIFSNISDQDIEDAEDELPPLPMDVEVAAIKEGEEVPEGRTEPKETSAELDDKPKQKLLRQSNDSYSIIERKTEGTGEKVIEKNLPRAEARKKLLAIRAARSGQGVYFVMTEDKKTSDAALSQLAFHHGLYMVIETPRGAYRRGRDWEATMPADYGYIRSFKGADGDQIDAYLGPDPTSGNVYVIDQSDQAGAFDEHKCMLGYGNSESALADYVLSHTEGKDLIMSCNEVSMDDFKNWLATGDLSKPYGGITQ